MPLNQCSALTPISACFRSLHSTALTTGVDRCEPVENRIRSLPTHAAKSACHIAPGLVLSASWFGPLIALASPANAEH